MFFLPLFFARLLFHFLKSHPIILPKRLYQRLLFYTSGFFFFLFFFFFWREMIPTAIHPSSCFVIHHSRLSFFLLFPYCVSFSDLSPFLFLRRSSIKCAYDYFFFFFFSFECTVVSCLCCCMVRERDVRGTDSNSFTSSCRGERCSLSGRSVKGRERGATNDSRS